MLKNVGTSIDATPRDMHGAPLLSPSVSTYSLHSVAGHAFPANCIFTRTNIRPAIHRRSNQVTVLAGECLDSASWGSWVVIAASYSNKHNARTLELYLPGGSIFFSTKNLLQKYRAPLGSRIHLCFSDTGKELGLLFQSNSGYWVLFVLDLLPLIENFATGQVRYWVSRIPSAAIDKDWVDPKKDGAKPDKKAGKKPGVPVLTNDLWSLKMLTVTADPFHSEDVPTISVLLAPKTHKKGTRRSPQLSRRVLSVSARGGSVSLPPQVAGVVGLVSAGTEKGPGELGARGQSALRILGARSVVSFKGLTVHRAKPTLRDQTSGKLEQSMMLHDLPKLWLNPSLPELGRNDAVVVYRPADHFGGIEFDPNFGLAPPAAQHRHSFRNSFTAAVARPGIIQLYHLTPGTQNRSESVIRRCRVDGPNMAVRTDGQWSAIRLILTNTLDYNVPRHIPMAFCQDKFACFLRGDQHTQGSVKIMDVVTGAETFLARTGLRIGKLLLGHDDVIGVHKDTEKDKEFTLLPYPVTPSFSDLTLRWTSSTADKHIPVTAATKGAEEDSLNAFHDKWYLKLGDFVSFKIPRELREPKDISDVFEEEQEAAEDHESVAKDFFKGVVSFIGKTHFGDGEWVGIQLSPEHRTAFCRRFGQPKSTTPGSVFAESDASEGEDGSPKPLHIRSPGASMEEQHEGSGSDSESSWNLSPRQQRGADPSDFFGKTFQVENAKQSIRNWEEDDETWELDETWKLNLDKDRRFMEKPWLSLNDGTVAGHRYFQTKPQGSSGVMCTAIFIRRETIQLKLWEGGMDGGGGDYEEQHAQLSALRSSTLLSRGESELPDSPQATNVFYLPGMTFFLAQYSAALSFFDPGHNAMMVPQKGEFCDVSTGDFVQGLELWNPLLSRWMRPALRRLLPAARRSVCERSVIYLDTRLETAVVSAPIGDLYFSSAEYEAAVFSRANKTHQWTQVGGILQRLHRPACCTPDGRFVVVNMDESFASSTTGSLEYRPVTKCVRIIHSAGANSLGDMQGEGSQLDLSADEEDDPRIDTSRLPRQVQAKQVISIFVAGSDVLGHRSSLIRSFIRKIDPDFKWAKNRTTLTLWDSYMLFASEHTYALSRAENVIVRVIEWDSRLKDVAHPARKAALRGEMVAVILLHDLNIPATFEDVRTAQIHSHLGMMLSNEMPGVGHTPILVAGIKSNLSKNPSLVDRIEARLSKQGKMHPKDDGNPARTDVSSESDSSFGDNFFFSEISTSNDENVQELFDHAIRAALRVFREPVSISFEESWERMDSKTILLPPAHFQMDDKYFLLLTRQGEVFEPTTEYLTKSVVGSSLSLSDLHLIAKDIKWVEFARRNSAAGSANFPRMAVFAGADSCSIRSLPGCELNIEVADYPNEDLQVHHILPWNDSADYLSRRSGIDFLVDELAGTLSLAIHCSDQQDWPSLYTWEAALVDILAGQDSIELFGDISFPNDLVLDNAHVVLDQEELGLPKIHWARHVHAGVLEVCLERDSNLKHSTVVRFCTMRPPTSILAMQSVPNFNRMIERAPWILSSPSSSVPQVYYLSKRGSRVAQSRLKPGSLTVDIKEGITVPLFSGPVLFSGKERSLVEFLLDLALSETKKNTRGRALLLLEEIARNDHGAAPTITSAVFNATRPVIPGRVAGYYQAFDLNEVDLEENVPVTQRSIFRHAIERSDRKALSLVAQAVVRFIKHLRPGSVILDTDVTEDMVEVAEFDPVIGKLLFNGCMTRAAAGTFPFAFGEENAVEGLHAPPSAQLTEEEIESGYGFNVDLAFTSASNSDTNSLSVACETRVMAIPNIGMKPSEQRVFFDGKGNDSTSSAAINQSMFHRMVLSRHAVDILATRPVQLLIEWKWRRFCRGQFFRVAAALVARAALTALCFLSLTEHEVHKPFERSQADAGSGFELFDDISQTPWGWIGGLTATILLISLPFTIFFELKQLSRVRARRYFGELDNWIDLGSSLTLGTALILFFFEPRPRQLFQPFAAVAALLMFATLLRLLRAHPRTGPLLTLLGAVMRDLLPFLLLQAILLFGFFLAFRILLPESGSFSTVFIAAFSVFRLLVGDFDVNDYSGQNGFHTVAAYVLLLLYLTFVVIITLNLLIALLSDTFERVQATRAQEGTYALASTIADLERDASNKDMEKAAYNPMFLVAHYPAKFSLPDSLESEFDDHTSESSQTAADRWQGRIAAVGQQVRTDGRNTRHQVEELRGHVAELNGKIDALVQVVRDLAAETQRQ